MFVTALQRALICNIFRCDGSFLVGKPSVATTHGVIDCLAFFAHAIDV